jgi:hypothetical protein
MVVSLLQLLYGFFPPSSVAVLLIDDGYSDSEQLEETEQAMVNNIRGKEILAKAITGILLLMLKWFRASRMPLSSESDNRCP